jgi:hypothetical protein
MNGVMSDRWRSGMTSSGCEDRNEILLILDLAHRKDNTKECTLLWECANFAHLHAVAA